MYLNVVTVAPSDITENVNRLVDMLPKVDFSQIQKIERGGMIDILEECRLALNEWLLSGSLSTVFLCNVIVESKNSTWTPDYLEYKNKLKSCIEQTLKMNSLKFVTESDDGEETLVLDMIEHFGLNAYLAIALSKDVSIFKTSITEITYRIRKLLNLTNNEQWLWRPYHLEALIRVRLAWCDQMIADLKSAS